MDARDGNVYNGNISRDQQTLTLSPLFLHV
jgi:hypothetical protein